MIGGGLDYGLRDGLVVLASEGFGFRYHYPNEHQPNRIVHLEVARGRFHASLVAV